MLGNEAVDILKLKRARVTSKRPFNKRVKKYEVYAID